MADTAVVRQRSPRIITIKNRTADPDVVYVEPEGTVRFDNQDDKDYRVRLFTREHHQHADIDILVPAYGSATFMVDPRTEEGKCDYELIETNLARRERKTGEGDGGETPDTAGGGGRIVIGPNPGSK
jgi:hypothetical protein